MDQIKECFWCDELIQNDEKFVTLKSLGNGSTFEIYFHLIHYSAFAFWIGKKTQFDNAQFGENYKFKRFLELSERDRNEEEQISKEQGLGREFRKDRFNFFNVLIYNTIEETLVDEEV